MTTTTFGKQQLPGQKNEVGAPNVCTGCGAVGSVHLTITDGTFITVECWECGMEYDPDRAGEVLEVLGSLLAEEDK